MTQSAQLDTSNGEPVSRYAGAPVRFMIRRCRTRLLARRLTGSPGAVAVVALLALLVVVPAESFAQGCAMCATYLNNGDDPRAEAFKISMLFLMSMPFVIVGAVGGWILWMYRRNRPQRPALRVLRTEREGT